MPVTVPGCCPEGYMNVTAELSDHSGAWHTKLAGARHVPHGTHYQGKKGILGEAQ